MGIDFNWPMNPPAADGCRYFLIAVDYFSPFILQQPLPRADAYHVTCTFLFVWSALFGWPEATYSDNSSHFKNDTLEQISARHGTGSW